MEQIAEAALRSKEGAMIAHEELVAVCVGAADAGLVHLNTPIALSRHYSVKLPSRCESVAAGTITSMPWQIFLVPALKEKLAKALDDLDSSGYAIVDNVLGT